MRQPKPFFRRFTKTWYVTIRGKQTNLGRDKDVAFQKYHELMASRGMGQNHFPTVALLLDAYLTWVKENRASGTYDKSVHFLSSFVDFAGAQLRIDAIEPLHVIRWVETKKSWNSTSRCDAISAMQRAFNWGVKRGQIARSPIAVVADKPRRKRRETVYSQNDWKKLRGLVKDQQFGDLLDFMRNTGCRPIEARTVCSHHVDLENKMVVFPPSEAKGERNERVVFLPDEAVEICKRLVRGDSADPILLNIKGRPWTKDAINCRFRRLREKLGIGACAYAVRHTYATEALKKGIDSLTLAQIMGHSDTSMLAKHYAHLARNPDYLREQASKAAS